MTKILRLSLMNIEINKSIAIIGGIAVEDIYETLLERWGELKSKERKYGIIANKDYSYTSDLREVQKDLEKLDNMLKELERDM